MRPIIDKHPDVKVSSHAWQRWRERSSKTKPRSPRGLAGIVSTLLYNALGQGVEPDHELSIRLEMAGIIAVVKVDLPDGWVVKTFLRPEEEEKKEAG